jgi:hypothetical protein
MHVNISANEASFRSSVPFMHMHPNPSNISALRLSPHSLPFHIFSVTFFFFRLILKEILEALAHLATMDSYTSSELRRYNYAPLSSPDALRVLRLRPAGDEEEDIDCEIIEIALENEPLNDIGFRDGEAYFTNRYGEETHRMTRWIRCQGLPPASPGFSTVMTKKISTQSTVIITLEQQLLTPLKSSRE